MQLFYLFEREKIECVKYENLVFFSFFKEEVAGMLASPPLVRV